MLMYKFKQGKRKNDGTDYYCVRLWYNNGFSEFLNSRCTEIEQEFGIYFGWLVQIWWDEKDQNLQMMTAIALDEVGTDDKIDVYFF